jgi:hypothetical protein
MEMGGENLHTLCLNVCSAHIGPFMMAPLHHNPHLTALNEAIAQIRRVRIGGRPFRVWPVDNDWDLQYRLAWCLELVLGLRLDKLTVLGSRHANTAWDALKRPMEYKDSHQQWPKNAMHDWRYTGMFRTKPYICTLLREPDAHESPDNGLGHGECSNSLRPTPECSARYTSVHS